MHPPSPRSRRALAVLTATACALVGLTTLAPRAEAAATAPADHLIITEVYGGGGNAGATLTHDFVELYNPTSAPIDLTGYVVRYYSAAGNLGNTCALSGTIAPGSHHLIQQAKGNGGTQPLPTPDTICTAAMGAATGSVLLSNADGDVDLVGYGTVKLYEGAPTEALSNTTSASRLSFADTDNNAADFAPGTPNPRNSGGVDPDPARPRAGT